MIRRTFTLTPPEGDYNDLQLLVTYDAETDTMHVGTRVRDYDTWSRPLALVSSDDDPVGRTGGLGSLRGATAAAGVEGGLLGRLINLVEEYTGTPIATPDVDPATQTQVAAVPNQTRTPPQDTTAMQEDPMRDRRGV